jgi:hypothetical protein
MSYEDQMRELLSAWCDLPANERAEWARLIIAAAEPYRDEPAEPFRPSCEPEILAAQERDAAAKAASKKRPRR